MVSFVLLILHVATVDFCISGFCAISKELPLLQGIDTEIIVSPLAPRSGGGLNTAFGEKVHCIAAEPHATFLRLAVSDCGTEAAYETAVKKCCVS